jgi:hypothetical protein
VIIIIIIIIIILRQRLLTCGPRTPGGPRRLLRGSATVCEIKYFFPSRLRKYTYVKKKAKSETENLKTLCKSEGI